MPTAQPLRGDSRHDHVLRQRPRARRRRRSPSRYRHACAATSSAAGAAATAAATTGVREPNRLPERPEVRLSSLTSTRSPAEVSASSDLTLSSSATCRRSSSGKSAHPAADTSARDSGCRVRTLELGPRRPAELDDASHQGHLRAQRRVDRAGLRLGPGLQVDASRQRPGSTSWTSRSCTSSVMNGTNGAISRVTVSRHSCSVVEGRRVAVPEPPSGPPDVPVGQVVDELGQPATGPGRVEVIERLGDLDHGAVQLRARPAIEQRPVGGGPVRHGPGSTRSPGRRARGTTRCSST